MRRTGNPISCPLSKGLPTAERLAVVERHARILLDAAWEEYIERVLEIAGDVQEASVNRFVDAKPSLSFKAGMGGWYIYVNGEKLIRQSYPADVVRGEVDRFPDDRYKALVGILEMEVEGIRFGDLGSLMADYPSKGEND